MRWTALTMTTMRGTWTMTTEQQPEAPARRVARSASFVQKADYDRAVTRAEVAEAKLAEVREGVTTFRTHYAGALGGQAADLACAVLQVIDRKPLKQETRRG